MSTRQNRNDDYPAADEWSLFGDILEKRAHELNDARGGPTEASIALIMTASAAAKVALAILKGTVPRGDARKGDS